MIDWKKIRKNPKDERNWSKSAITKHACRQKGIPIINLKCSTFTKEDFLGLPTVK